MIRQTPENSPKYIQRICKHHGETKYRLGLYAKNKYRYDCIACTSDLNKRRNITRKVLRETNKHNAIEYLGGKCSICGYNKCIDALDFHHKDPKEKEFTISKRIGKSKFNDIKSELDKCVLVCANCHREIHNL